VAHWHAIGEMPATLDGGDRPVTLIGRAAVG